MEKRYTRLRLQTFITATLGYGIYYVCRLSLNVVKKPIVDEGILSETELGIIGSALFITYAIGKLVNGFLADRANIRRFMSLGLPLGGPAGSCRSRRAGTSAPQFARRLRPSSYRAHQ